jgi:hypothetical protein
MDEHLINLLSTVALVSIPTVAVAGGFYMAVRAFMQRDQQIRLLELQTATHKDTRMLRLQAYERLILFLERITPGALISRVMDSEMISHELQLAMILSIRGEYEHNLTQQLYISSETWQVVVQAKDEMIKTVAVIATQYPPDITAQQLAKSMLESIAQADMTLPTVTAIEHLKAEARAMM